MPPRSPKMKRRILGFQRRVWWPKWTPASSSSLMPTWATDAAPLCMDVGLRPGESEASRTRRSTAPGRAAGLGRRALEDRPGSGSDATRGLTPAPARAERRRAGRPAAASARRPARRSPGARRPAASACRNWRSRPSSAGASPYSGSPATGWPIACRCARIWWVRPVSRRTRSSVTPRQRRARSSKCVTAARGSSVSVDIRVRTRRSRPSGASIVPAARRRAALDEREVLARHLARAAERLCSARVRASVRATTSSPEVSRSRRWTMPGALGSSPPGRAAGQRLHERARRGARAPGARRRRRACRPRAGARPRRRRANGAPAASRPPPAARRLRRPSTRSPAAQRVALGPRGAVDAHARRRRSAAARAAREPSGAGEEDVEPLARVAAAVDAQLAAARVARAPSST